MLVVRQTQRQSAASTLHSTNQTKPKPKPPTAREDNAPADELANLAVDVDEAISEIGRWTRGKRAGERGEVVGYLADKMQIENR